MHIYLEKRRIFLNTSKIFCKIFSIEKNFISLLLMFSARTCSGYELKLPYSFNGYEVLENISQGSFSTVIKVQDEFSKRFFAAKIFSTKELEDQNQRKLISNEVEILRSLSHPNIVKFYEMFKIFNDDNEEFIVIIEEYCPKGCLLDYMNNFGFKNDMEKKKVQVGLVNAIKYLHEQGIAHCDIKPENVLLDINCNPKLCDFGFSKNFNKTFDEIKCGSIDYAAPELFKDGSVDFFKSDIWSLGITLFAMSEMRFPFNDVRDVINGRLSIRTNDEKLEKIVKKCTKLNPKKRPNAEEILNDEYFSLSKEET